MSRWIFQFQFEEPETKAWINLEEGDICFDIGAHHGWYTILFGKKVGEKGLIVAVEPNPENLNFLAENIRLNKLKNVEIVACALSDKFGETQLWFGEHSGLNSITHNTDLGSVTVKILPLDSLLQKFGKVKLLKMDIEDAELLVLSACKLLGRVERFIVEVHSQQNMVGLTKLFAKRGFEVKIIYGSRDFILATRRN